MNGHHIQALDSELWPFFQAHFADWSRRHRRDKERALSGLFRSLSFGTLCPKGPGLGRLPNKHFAWPLACKNGKCVHTWIACRDMYVCPLIPSLPLRAPPGSGHKKQMCVPLCILCFIACFIICMGALRSLILFRLRHWAYYQFAFCIRCLCSWTDILFLHKI